MKFIFFLLAVIGLVTVAVFALRFFVVPVLVALAAV